MPWKERLDPQTNKTYFYNTETKETSWKKPQEVLVDASKEAAAPLAGGGSAAGEQWAEKVDAKSGRTYFFNKVTRETSWKRPPGLDVAGNVRKADASSTAEKPSQWLEKRDPKSGKKFFFNVVTKETRWATPDESSEGTAISGERSSAAAAGDVKNVWEEKSDPKTGKKYFFHRETKQTSWTRPAEQGSDNVAGTTAPELLEHPQSVRDGTQNSEADDEWVAKTDVKSGKTYYYNKKSKQTSWTRPAATTPAAAAEGLNARAAGAPSSACSGEDVLESLVTALGPHWRRGYEYRTGNIYALNTRTGEKRWLDSVTNEFTAILQLHDVPHETLFVFGGHGSSKTRQCVFVFLGTRWVTLRAERHGIPFDFHSVQAVRITPSSCVLLGMRRDAGSLAAVLTWNSHLRQTAAQELLVNSYRPGSANAAVPLGFIATGGAEDAGMTRPVSTATLHDLAAGVLHRLPPMREPRCSHSVAVVDYGSDTRVLWFAFVCGGFDGKRKTANVERYILGAAGWDSMAPLSRPRSGHCAFGVEKMVYVVGGRTGYAVTNSMEAMHVQTDSWSPMAAMRVPRCSFACAPVGSYVLAVGGYNGSEWLTSVEAYDPRIDLWRDVVALPTPCCSLGACTLQKMRDPTARMPEDTVAEPSPHQ